MKTSAHPFLHVLNEEIDEDTVQKLLSDEHAKIYGLLKSLNNKNEEINEDLGFFLLNCSIKPFNKFKVFYCLAELENKKNLDEYEGSKILDKYFQITIDGEIVRQKYKDLDNGLYIEYRPEKENGNLTIGTLLDELVENNAGRPSTYASIIEGSIYADNSSVDFDNSIANTVLNARENNRPLIINNKGKMLLEVLKKEPNVINLDKDFTCKLENALTKIENGEVTPVEVIEKFTSFLSSEEFLNQKGNFEEFHILEKEGLLSEEEKIFQELKNDLSSNILIECINEFFGEIDISQYSCSLEMKEEKATLIYLALYNGKIDRFYSRIIHDRQLRYIIGFKPYSDIWSKNYLREIIENKKHYFLDISEISINIKNNIL